MSSRILSPEVTSPLGETLRGPFVSSRSPGTYRRHGVKIVAATKEPLKKMHAMRLCGYLHYLPFLDTVFSPVENQTHLVPWSLLVDVVWTCAPKYPPPALYR